MRSLVIEDEPQIGAYLGRLLEQLHGIVDIVASVSDARQALNNFKYDLAIVDRMLPDGDALDIVTALSRLPERPAIIMLTAKDTKEDVIDGLDCEVACAAAFSGAARGTSGCFQRDEAGNSPLLAESAITSALVPGDGRTTSAAVEPGRRRCRRGRPISCGADHPAANRSLASCTA